MRVGRLCAWLAVAGVVVAAAQPTIQAAPSGRVGILELVVDRSGSTLAGDVAPTRLGAIQQATLRLLDRVPPRVRVGLVAFSDKAETLVHPTTNRDAVRAKLTSLWADGGTAVGDALRRALDDIQAARPAAPAAVLLLSDGAHSTGSYPPDVARVAAARQVPVFAVAVGTPEGFLSRPDAIGSPRRQPVPPDPVQLAAIAGPTGGRAVEARSAPALDAALDDLGRDAGVPGEPQELALLFAAAALLLAIGSALSPRRRASDGARTGLPAVARRLAPSVTLLVAAGGIVLAWAQWPPTGLPPAGRPAAAAAFATIATPARPPPPPPFVTIDAANGRDRTIVRQATALLRRHGELADQRQAEIKRHRLNRVTELNVTACDVCKAEPLTATPTIATVSGGISCGASLNMPILRKVAQRAHVPVGTLAAMVIHYEQELCLYPEAGGTRRAVAVSPFTAELRLARQLHAGRLFDLLYAQVDAGGRDWRTVMQAVVVLRDHGELAVQRRDELHRRGHNQIGPLQIGVCRDCLAGWVGEAAAGLGVGGATGCEIRLDLAEIERGARHWGMSATEFTASILVHEQEHCVRDPDDRETPAIDAQRRLARELGNPRHLEYVTSLYGELDRSGYWRQ